MCKYRFTATTRHLTYPILTDALCCMSCLTFGTRKLHQYMLCFCLIQLYNEQSSAFLRSFFARSVLISRPFFSHRSAKYCYDSMCHPLSNWPWSLPISSNAVKPFHIHISHHQGKVCHHMLHHAVTIICLLSIISDPLTDFLLVLSPWALPVLLILL